MKISTLLPMACDGVGPSQTCLNLLQAMRDAGAGVSVHVDRRRAAVGGLETRVAVPQPLSFLPYRWIRSAASRSTEAAYLAGLRDGDLAYLWPAASLRTHEIVYRRGNPIILEAINTRMAHARRVLDEIYEAAGIAPEHYITDERIKEEEAKLSLARAIFAPSPGVEAALRGSGLAADGILASSYGVYVQSRRRAIPGDSAKPVFLFVGYVCLRKGAHQLLRAWADAKIEGTLVLAGAIEPAVARLCADELNGSDVRANGFVRDVAALFQRAHAFVLPSFEEGDPLVTYEAASFGLPIIASPMGAGRMGSETGCTIPVDPAEPDAISFELRRLATSPDVREEWGAKAFAAVQKYGWRDVGSARLKQLQPIAC